MAAGKIVGAKEPQLRLSRHGVTVFQDLTEVNSVKMTCKKSLTLLTPVKKELSLRKPTSSARLDRHLEEKIQGGKN
ncbi:hypothetical protein V6Z11_D13G018000 [Gossypium hirsutum]